MNPLVAEFIGTMLLVLIGDGVCANASLSQTKGQKTANWLFVNAGWGMAVYVAVLCTSESSGAHLNPAVSIGLAAAGEFAWSQVTPYVASQVAGALLGAVLVYIMYTQHFSVTEDADAKLGTFCTAPSIRGAGHNLISETLGTFALIFAVLMTAKATLDFDGHEYIVGLGAIGALPVALVVFAVGMGLGGTTGYAINPARDFAPRLAHQLLPIPGKRDSDWGYAWIPILGPILGGLLAAGIYLAAGS